MTGQTPKVLKGLALALIAPHFLLSGPAAAVTDREYFENCESMLASCHGDNNPLCVQWRAAFAEHGNACPASNEQPKVLSSPDDRANASPPASGAKTTRAPSLSNAVDRLGKIQADCDSAYGNLRFSDQVACLKDRISASHELSAADIYGEAKLYQLTAENLADEVGQKKISSGWARLELQKAYLEFRDRLNRRASAEQAHWDAMAEQTRQTEAAATAAIEAETNRRANAKVIEDAQNREFQQRRAELVAFCVATAKQRIGANPMYVNEHFFQGIHPDSNCAADPYWYKTIPTVQSQVAGYVAR